MTNKEQYCEWAPHQEHLPIFMQPWWLDAVCAGKQWDVLLSHDEHGSIQAAMPYMLTKKFWHTWISTPPMTQHGGAWLSQNGGLIEGTDLAIDIRRISEDIVEQMSALKISFYTQQFPIASKIVTALKALDFRVKQRVTYRIEDLHDLDKVINAFSKSKKVMLQKSLSLHAERGLTAEEFYSFHSSVMQTKHKELSYTREFLLVLDRKARRNGQAETIAIKNADGNIYAAAFLVWDKHTLYYLIPAIDPLHKNSGASALLVLEALKLAREKGVIMDFCSQQHRAQDNHYKQFGAQKAEYCLVEKSFSPMSFFIRIFGA